MSGLIIFGLLIALMLSGMPISIALGLTVLTFLFTLTQVPIESVALEPSPGSRTSRSWRSRSSSSPATSWPMAAWRGG